MKLHNIIRFIKFKDVNNYIIYLVSHYHIHIYKIYESIYKNNVFFSNLNY